MVLRPLQPRPSPVPAFDWQTPLADVALALGRLEAIAPSHVVVVDAQRRPLGALGLGQLWAAQAQGDRRCLADCQAWLGPIVTVALPLTAANPSPWLAALGDEETPLVAVDGAGQYLGLLPPAQLLAAVEPRSPSDSRVGGQGQRAWVLELSHAFKTPMTTLLGLSTLLLDSRVGSLSDRQFRYVNLMRQAIRRLTSLVNLLIDWMRLESGQIALHPEPVDLAALAQELLPSFLVAQPDIDRSWADRFAVQLMPGTGAALADPLRLRQSLHYSLSYLLGQGIVPSGLTVEPWGAWLGLTLAGIGPGPQPPADAPAPDALALGTAAPEPQSLEEVGLSLAQRFSQLQGGDLCGLATAAGYRLTLLLPAPPDQAPETALVVLACGSAAVVAQVYASLEGSPYRLVVAPTWDRLVDRLALFRPVCILVHPESLGVGPDPGALEQVDRARTVVVRSPDSPPELQTWLQSWLPNSAIPVLTLTELPQTLRPTLDRLCTGAAAGAAPALVTAAGLTLLLVQGPGEETLPEGVQHWLGRHRCRLLQVDSLAQARLLSRVWQPGAIILDGVEPIPLAMLQTLAQSPDLAALPVVTLAPLVAGATVLGLALAPCPDLLELPPAQAVERLLGAIAAARSPAYPAGHNPASA
jgi:hypothetical protein